MFTMIYTSEMSSSYSDVFRTEAHPTHNKVTVFIMSNKKSPHKSNTPKKKKKENIDRITEPALIRILRRAGVTRARKDIYPTMRECITRFINPILYNSWVIAENNKRKTLKKKHLCQAMVSLGLDLVCPNNLNNIYVKTKSKKEEHIRKETGKRAEPGESALEEVRRLQNSDELLVTRLPIERLIKEHLKEINENIKSSSLFILTLHVVIEVFLTNLIKDSFGVLKLEEDEGKTHKSLTKINVESAFRLRYKKFYLLSLLI